MEPTTLTIQVSDANHASLELIAKKDNRSVESVAAEFLANYLKEYRANLVSAEDAMYAGD